MRKVRMSKWTWTNMWRTAMPQTSWTHILHLQITPKIHLLWASIMIQYHIRIIFINLSLLRTPTIIWHCLFEMLVCLRQKLIQLLHLLKIKACDYLWLMWFVSAWHVIQNFIHLPFVRDLLNTMQNMEHLQKWRRLIENPTLLFLNIVINMYYAVQYLRSISLSQAQQINNYIYMISYLLCIQIIILYKNLHMYQLQVLCVSPMTIMVP